MESDREGSVNYRVANAPCQSEPLRRRRHLVGNEESFLFAH